MELNNSKPLQISDTRSPQKLNDSLVHKIWSPLPFFHHVLYEQPLKKFFSRYFHFADNISFSVCTFSWCLRLCDVKKAINNLWISTVNKDECQVLRGLETCNIFFQFGILKAWFWTAKQKSRWMFSIAETWMNLLCSLDRVSFRYQFAGTSENKQTLITSVKVQKFLPPSWLAD